VKNGRKKSQKEGMLEDISSSFSVFKKDFFSKKYKKECHDLEISSFLAQKWTDS